jgi:hypothetical protein
LILLALFLLALLPRLHGANTVGWHWDRPGSFSLVNFDEAGSCRAALEGFRYTPFIGYQTIALATSLGHAPGPGIEGDARAVKAFCHSPGHLTVARNYAAVTGALTVVAISLIALMLVPERPAVAWTAGALLALSGFHASESQTGTVDAPSVFFIYAFLALMIYAVTSGRRGWLALSPLLLIPAVWTKYWVFAILSYLALLPTRAWSYLSQGMSRRRVVLVTLATCVLFGLVTNSEFQRTGLYPLLALYYLNIPWRKIRRPMWAVWLAMPLLAYGLTRIDIFATYTTGAMSGGFGTSYGAIGWHKWLRNLVNLPAVLVVGLGLPACLFIPAGIRAVPGDSERVRGWLCLLPLLAFALFMAFLAPVTYYRHYLALMPVAALLSARGLFETSWSGRRWFLAVFFLWPALLAYDMLSDYQRDPRIELREWYAGHADDRIFFSYYVNPPPTLARNSRLFRPEYAFGDAAILRQADYLILSENWYDTAFPNELNGPLTGAPRRLVKTRPEYAAFYQDTIAGRHPLLAQERVIPLRQFMPELLLHRALYGTFQLFVGDIRIYRVVKSP